MAAGVLVCLRWGAAGAQPCPPRLVGPDPALSAEISGHLDVNTATTAPAAGCRPLTVQVRADADGILLWREGADTEPRRVHSPATAASLVTAWSASALSDLAWLDPTVAAAPLPPTATGTIAAITAVAAPPPAPGARPRLATAPPVAAPAPRARWALTGGAVGLVSDGGAWGVGAELAGRAAWGRWRVGPTLRVHVDRQAGAALTSGARALEAGLGLFGGARLLQAWLPLDLQLALRGAYRAVDPTEPVGALACQPAAPCAIGDPVPADPGVFHAFTGWAEASVATQVGLAGPLGLEVSVGAGVNPGFATVDAPVTADAPAERLVRQAPRLPRWRAFAVLALRWEGL